MTKKRTVSALLLLLALAATTWILLFDAAPEAPRYELAAVERGDLQSTVTATGTLGARETVEVGTQVSGTIAAVYADYNDVVQRGQLLAVIEPEALDAAVRDAEAGVDRAEAQRIQAIAQLQAQQTGLADARAHHDRSAPLHERGFLSDAEFGPLQTAVAAAEAQVQAQQAAVASADASVASAGAVLDRARTNRSDAEIRSPIGGVVVSRDVDEGQTVAASLSAPTLFVIAKDLAQMEILANVDESDVGRIAPGQPVSFTVAAHPDHTFEGVTRSIRLQPQSISNVVNYTVVVEAANEAGLLLPGMTATVDFVTEQAVDALLVPTAALSVQPTAEMAAAMQRRRDAAPADAAPADSAAVRVVAAADRPALQPLWYLDAAGVPQRALVRTGTTDGFTTEIVPQRGELAAGTQVIVSVESGAEGAAAPAMRTPGSPFDGGPGPGMRRGL